ncbi:O-antigen ligase family protein [Salinivibrio sp. SS2]|uniref:O-antigen ligase family protein n=1 Tax=Salinivibrio sp. SS2 TaxID=1892894 RepID=UPI00084C4911|nr:O-antigen ligase family protein [Salinivibrio sp. DV]ODP99264.1 hypothetical protein BGK46_10895 [Salinivibrio sp. DV]
MSYVMYLISILLISSDYFRFALNIPFMDRISVGISLVVFLYCVLIKRRKFKVLSFGFLSLLIAYYSFIVFYSLVKGNSIPAVVYGTVKISTFLFFMPLFSVLTSSELKSAVRIFVNVSIVYLSFNLFVMCLQIIFGDSIVSLFGMPAEMYNSTMKSGRPMGLYGNLPALSLSAVCLYVLIDGFFPELCQYKLKKIILLTTIILSTSKIAILILAMYFLFKYLKIKGVLKLVYIVVLFSSLVAYALNNELFVDKFVQLGRIISLGDNFYAADLTLVDWRFYCYVLAIQIFFDNPLGLGLATWGDFSSTLNSNITHNYTLVNMSDSAYSHLFVEQGVFVFLYLFVIMYPCLKKKDRRVLFFPAIAFVSFISTMGFSDTTWPAIYAFCLSSILFSHQLRFRSREGVHNSPSTQQVKHHYKHVRQCR